MTRSPAPAERPPRTSRCWTLRGAQGAVDVEVVGADDEPVVDVLPCLVDALGVPVTGLWAGDQPLDEQVALGAPELRHGAVLGVDGPARTPRRAASPLELRFLGGPDAGRVLPLDRGVHVVGRDRGCGVRVTDADVSRRHLEVRVGDGAVEVRDLGSTNGSVLDDEQLDDRFRRWPDGAGLRLGATTLAVSGAHDPPAALEPAGGGRTRVRPPLRLRALREDVEVALPRPPADPPRRRLAWAAVLLPAVGGVLLAGLLRTPTFLFFALLSPLAALGTWASDRWSGRRSGRRDAAAYQAQLAAAHDELADAVRADVGAAQREHPDPAAVVAAVARRTAAVWSRPAGDGEPLVVRVGSGPGPVRVSRIETDGRRQREVAERVPVVVDLPATGGLAVLGPRAQGLGVLRVVLAQLVALHPPDGLRLLLLTRPDRLADWRWTRWLPHLAAGAVRVAADPGAEPDVGEELRRQLTALVADRSPAAAVGRTVVVVDRQVDGRTAALLRAARGAGVVLVGTAERAEGPPVAVDATLTLSGETATSAVLAQDSSADRPVVVDRLADDLAEELSRGLADLVPVASGAALPAEVRLLELPGPALRLDGRDAVVGRWSEERGALRTVLGRSADGPVEVDLCRDGPHVLVAGTTGSGKSELLQSLVAGLALGHPPERCSFLLVDYKGGAAFAETARLPHTVGMLTDLDGSTTARALRSLTAELSRREALLAEHGVPDLAALPGGVELARLVIVVDEFATLVEELPAFVPGLVGIAQRGRSLGIHLVLATQRPGGVVSPEIRANCTLRICLRTTDESDSRDVVGTPAAAHLPVHAPGRALLRTGNGAPRLLQVARVATAPAGTDGGVVLGRWAWPHTASTQRPRPGRGPTDLERVVDALTREAEVRGIPAPHRPWQPPLPDRLSPDDLAGHRSAAPRDPAARPVPIGLVDHPGRQAREPLELDLAAGGGVLAVGGPRSGRSTFLRSVLRSATSLLGPAELHVHVIEAGGGGLCAEAAALPHTGTGTGAADVFRTVRLLDRLAREVEARRAAPPGSPAPLLLLLVDGVEQVSTVLDEADPGRGSDALLRVVREGAAVGVTCVLTADRALPGGRLGAAARLRLVLPLPDRADYTVAGVPPRAVPTHRPPGRALLGEDALECQLVLPGPPAAPSTAPPDPGAPVRIRVVDLPADPALPVEVGPAAGRRLVVGPGGDDGGLLDVDVDRSGGLLVVGPPGSGRTAALTSFARRLAASGAEVAWLVPPHGAPAPGSTRIDPADTGALDAWVGGLAGRRGVLVADDLGHPTGYGGLSALPPLGALTGLALLAAGAPGQLTSYYQGPVAALRRARTGLLLRPGPADAEVLGIRLPRLPLPARAGSGWLVTDGTARRVQVARAVPADAPVPPR
ncbi:FtsK/SpoIIIE domain-containing protein [Blastococcus sp. SYSU D01042]